MASQVAASASAQQRAQARRGGEQHRGLALDHAQVGGLVGVRVAHVQQLQHLAFGDAVGGVGEDLHHRHALEFDHQLEAARIQEVADQHAGGIAPDRVGGAAAAAQVGLVDHVVVQQGRGVDELDHRRQLVGIGADALAIAAAQGPGREQQQHRPQALAAGADDVLGDLVDQHHVRGEPAPDQRIDRRHVLAGQGLDGDQVGDGQERGAGLHGRTVSVGAGIISGSSESPGSRVRLCRHVASGRGDRTGVQLAASRTDIQTILMSGPCSRGQSGPFWSARDRCRSPGPTRFGDAGFQLRQASGSPPNGTRPLAVGSAPPVVLPVWPGRRFVDLVANSLREVASRNGDAMYQLMAHAIVEHLAADVQGGASRRLGDEAMDGVLSLISTDLQRQVASSRRGRGPVL